MLLSIIIAFISIIFLMIIHEAGHFIIAKKCGIEVEEFGIGYPPRIFGKKIGKTLYSLNLLPLGAFVKIPGEIGGLEDYNSFSNLPIYKRALIVLGGVASFWLAGFIIFTIVFNFGVKIPILDSAPFPDKDVEVVVTTVVPDFPAEKAGIQNGDIIKKVSLGGTKCGKCVPTEIFKIEDFKNFVGNNKMEEITLTIQRGEELSQFNVVPKANDSSDDAIIGVQLRRVASLIPQYSWYMAPVKAISYSADLSVKVVAGLWQTLSDLFSGKGLPEGAEPAGPIGISVYIAKATNVGVIFFLYFIGFLSIVLAVFNLLPIPALDGGKLLFLIIEKIKKSPVSPKIEQRVTVIFFILLISLSIFVTIKFDIPNLFKFIKGF